MVAKARHAAHARRSIAPSAWASDPGREDAGTESEKETNMALIVTEIAARELAGIVQEHGIAEPQGLRLFARSGGCACSGPAFGMSIDNATASSRLVDPGTTLSGADYARASAHPG